MTIVITGRGMLLPGGKTADIVASGVETGLPCPTGPIADFAGSGAVRGTAGAVDRTTALAAEAARAALFDAGLDLGHLDQARLGIVLGSRHGSLEALAALVTKTACPCPTCFASSMNADNVAAPPPAGHCDLWYRLRALTAKVSGGYLSGLMALRHALGEIATGAASCVVLGTAAQLPAQQAGVLEQRRQRAGLTECGVSLVLEDGDFARQAGRRVHAEVLGCAIDRDPGLAERSAPRLFVGLLTRLLATAGLTAGDVSTVITSGLGHSTVDAYEAEAVDAVFFRARPRQVEVAPIFGNTMSGLNLLQMLAGLAADERAGGQGPVLVVSADPAGHVGAALLRRAAA
ncbi:MAG: beta-ketoacyl synthase N-terminal-like domain-containing protein [Hyphomicrobiales bacterium]